MSDRKTIDNEDKILLKTIFQNKSKSKEEKKIRDFNCNLAIATALVISQIGINYPTMCVISISSYRSKWIYECRISRVDLIYFFSFPTLLPGEEKRERNQTNDNGDIILFRR